MRLIFPTEQYKEQVLDYKKEFEQNMDSMDGTAGLNEAATYEEWLQSLRNNLSKETVRSGFVTASTFLAIREEDDRLVGMIDIRHELNDYLYHFGGNIGYSVRKTERKKGYATEMLCLALEECRQLGLDKVLMTCSKNNIASAKTMLRDGAVLEKEVVQGERTTQRYWIHLKEK